MTFINNLNVGCATFVGGSLIAVFYCYSRIRSLYSNIAAARSSGFDYVVLPFHVFGGPWIALQGFVLPLLQLLPHRWTERWSAELTFSRRGWHDGYSTFSKFGADTYIIVSPSQNILHTCEPEAVSQILRSSAFEKPTDLIDLLNIFGPTTTAAENREARQYRKVTAPFFNEDSMQRIWAQSLSGGEALLKVLIKYQRPGHNVEPRPLLARLSLYLLNSVCFESDQHCVEEIEGRSPIPSGHALGYSQAMHTMLDHVKIVYVVPRSLLRISPFSMHRKASKTYVEMKKYLNDLRDRKRAELHAKKHCKGFSLLDLIVRAGEPTDSCGAPALPLPAVIGNLFIFMFAGHEANANTLMFAMLLLACHPSIQKLLQRDIDKTLSHATSNGQSWSYESIYPVLTENMVFAVINETFRVASVLPFLPKIVPKGSPQPVKISGRTHVIPANTLVIVNTSAAHQHPKYWPQPRNGQESAMVSNPVASFNPKYWLGPRDAYTQGSSEPNGFLRPRTGSFLPFSDGSRGCLGKKFALVELCALIVRIFSEYSVELAVEGVEHGLSKADMKELWAKTRAKAEHELFASVEFDMSLRFKGTVPITFVKRGQENYADIVDV